MRALISILTAATLLVSGAAFAKEPGWYGGVSLGYTELAVGDGVKDKALGLGLLGGYQQNKYIAWEGEVQTSGEAKDSAMINGSSVDVEAKYESWAIGIVGMYPFAERFTVFGRFLPMYGRFTVDSSGGGESNKVTEREGGYTVGAGASAQFGPVDLRLRYDLQRVNFEKAPDIGYPKRLGLDVLWRF